MKIELNEMPFEELKSLLENVVGELKFRESESVDDGFDTIRTIEYLVGKYNEIVDARQAK